ncbi:MAG: acyltransferase [Lachnospiraceae bacterium]|jgi:hypothetical protein|nr:acyltransferase [Lachnospiraceae bacterium]
MGRKTTELNEAQFRGKVLWVSFLFTVLVIWTHAGNAALFLGESSPVTWAHRIERLLGQHVAQMAVPGFFMVSAYLFYRNFTWDKLASKWKSRIRSLLAPYLLWNALYYLGYVVASRLPGLSGVVGKGTIPFGVVPLAEAMASHTYLYVFWYLRQLIFLVALAPAIWFAVRRWWVFAPALAAVWVCVALRVRLPLINSDALFYYLVAARLGVMGRGAGVFFAERAWTRGGALAACAALAVAVMVFQNPVFYSNDGALVMLRVLLVAVVWVLVPEAAALPATGALPETEAPGGFRRFFRPAPWMRINFFVYASHFALVRLVNKGVAYLFHGGRALAVAVYLLMPVVAVAAAYGASVPLRRHAPALWGLLSGGR